MADREGMGEQENILQLPSFIALLLPDPGEVDEKGIPLSSLEGR